MSDQVVLLGVAAVGAAAAGGLMLARTRRDAVTIVTVLLVFLFALRRQWVVGPLGGVGSPAMLTGMLAAWIWFSGKINSRVGLDRTVNPVRLALFVYSAYNVLSYAVAHSRPLTELEASGSARNLIWLAAHVGVALLIADGVTSRERLDTLLRRLVAAGGFLSTLGIVAFFFGIDLAQRIRVPGLSLNRELSGLHDRNVFNRPAGTAQHPIEFSVVLAMILPIAIHFAMTAETQAARQRAWLATGIVALGIPLSISRSGIVGVTVALGLLALGWGWRRRFNAGVVGLMFLVVMWGTVPGLLGTIRNLFTRWGTDPSVQDRIERFPVVMEYVFQRPWFGIGAGTYSVEEYPLLDNGYYGWMITQGLVGFAILVGLFVAVIVTALSVRGLTRNSTTKHLGLALAATVSVAAVNTATFDAFHYRIFTGVLFVAIGAIGALWRLAYLARLDERSSHALAAPGPPSVNGARNRRV